MLDLKREDLNLLLIFEAISKMGSVSQAAQPLNVSQPMVSNALGQLAAPTHAMIMRRTRPGAYCNLLG